MAYPCQFHDGPAEATTLLTSLRDGQTLASCDDDVPIMLTGALAAFLNVDTGKLWGTIDRFAKKNQVTPPPPAEPAPADPEQVSITCPYCQTEMVVLPSDLELAQQDHLANCEQFKAQDESGSVK